MTDRITKRINFEVCCRDMKASMESGIVVINDGKLCLGGRDFKLKAPTKEYDRAIVLLNFCPWCGFYLKKITEGFTESILEDNDGNREH